MTLSRELVPNLPLAGDELARLILADAQALIDGDCMLSRSVAYGRCSYELRLTIHVDNPAFPLSESSFRSRRRATQEVSADAALSAVESHPLVAPTSADAFLSASERHRDMESPNAARVAQGLPVTVVTRESSGRHAEKSVMYPVDYADGANPPPIDADVSAHEAARLGIPDSTSVKAQMEDAVATADALAIIAAVDTVGEDVPV